MIDGYKDSDYVGIIKELCPELAGHDPRQARCTPTDCRFCATSSPCDSAQKGCYTWDAAHGARRAKCRLQEVLAAAR